MKVVAFNGSPRTEGNTARLLTATLTKVGRAGIATELLPVGSEPIHGCRACMACFKNKDRRCAQKDNALNEYLTAMLGSDGIVIGSPTYFADVSAQTKALIDRCGLVSRANDDMLRRKVGAAVVAVRRAGAIHAFDTINHFFTIGQMIVVGSSYWNIGVGLKPGEVEHDDEGMATMRTLGVNMAWLINPTPSGDRTPMKVVITGGSGFIGSHLAEHFHQKAEVVVVDNLRSGYEKNLAGLSVQLVRESVTNRDCLLEACRGADYLFHLAAMVSVPESVQLPQECVAINVQGFLNVLDAARTHKVRKVVLSSSAAIYGDSEVVPKVEGMTPQPISPYAITKLDSEYYLDLYRREHGLASVALRYFNVFGPRQDPKSQYAAAVPIFIARALANQDITIFGDGGQTRDFIFVKDVVLANELAATTEAMSGVYNVALGGRITINDLAQKIVALTGSSSRLVHAPPRLGDVRHSQACIDRLSACGFAPRFGLDEGLALTIRA